MRLAFGLPLLAVSRQAVTLNRSDLPGGWTGAALPQTPVMPKMVYGSARHATHTSALTKLSLVSTQSQSILGETVVPSAAMRSEQLHEIGSLEGKTRGVAASSTEGAHGVAASVASVGQARLPSGFGRVGVLIASHGDIDDLDEAEDYAKTAVLKNRAVPLPDFTRGIASKLGWLLVRNDIVNQYEAIGIKTNYRQNSEAQAKAIEKALRGMGIDARAYYGFNFTKPFIAQAMAQMRKDGIEHIVVFNQGAQYSSATGAENFRDVQEFLAETGDYSPSVVGVKQFSDDPRFRALLARRLQEDVDRIFPGVPYEDICILMGSHGLPNILQEKGDPATRQMLAATADIASRLPEALEVKQGFLNDDFFPGVSWTHPTAEELADEIAASGRKHILLDGRLSFTVHHRATFYDLDTEARDAIQAQVPDAKIVLADNFDGDPALADLMAQLAIESLMGQGDIEQLTQDQGAGAQSVHLRDRKQVEPRFVGGFA